VHWWCLREKSRSSEGWCLSCVRKLFGAFYIFAGELACCRGGAVVGCFVSFH